MKNSFFGKLKDPSRRGTAAIWLPSGEIPFMLLKSVADHAEFLDVQAEMYFGST
jgi:hypothetical protein